jgi:tryptophan 2,3-dioxygenase
VHDEHLFIVIHQGMRILLREIFTLWGKLELQKN